MGKVASDKCHKWVFKEPTECEPNISNYWQSSFDAVCDMSILLLNSNTNRTNYKSPQIVLFYLFTDLFSFLDFSFSN